MNEKKVTCSKIIVLVSYICAITLTVIITIGAFMGFDMSSLTPIALAAWGEVAASNVFYFRKAGRENILKIAQPLIQDGKIDPAEAFRQALNQ